MKYPVQDLIDAITSSLSSIEASKTFKIPARTIRSHRQTLSQKYGAGRHRYLNDEQDYLLSLIKLLPDYDFTVTSDVALQLAAEYIKLTGSSSIPGCKWLKLFVKRHKSKVRNDRRK